jgi:hypothetical protein
MGSTPSWTRPRTNPARLARLWWELVEFLLLKEGTTDCTPLRLFIDYNERVLEQDTAQDAGASLSDGAQVVSTQGCLHETLWPYDITKFAEQPPPLVYQDGLQHRAVDVQQMSQNLTTMKEGLATGLPIVVGFTVYQSFESPQVAQTGIGPLPRRREQIDVAILCRTHGDTELTQPTRCVR